MIRILLKSQRRLIIWKRPGNWPIPILCLSHAPESNTAEEIQRQRARFCSVWQVLEEAELTDEYDAWKCAGGGTK